MDYLSVGTQMDARRNSLGLSQCEVAVRADMKQQNYCEAEHGSNLTRKSLERIAGALQCEIRLIPDEKAAIIDKILNANDTLTVMQVVQDLCNSVKEPLVDAAAA